MSSTTQKHRDFMSEPMGDKAVTALPGIGPALGDRLKRAGFHKAFQVLGQFLVLDKNEERFRTWLDEPIRANREQQDECYNCLKEWCDRFVN